MNYNKFLFKRKHYLNKGIHNEITYKHGLYDNKYYFYRHDWYLKKEDEYICNRTSIYIMKEEDDLLDEEMKKINNEL